MFFLAHPRAIAAFGRECTRRGLYPGTVEVEDRRAFAWRGVLIGSVPMELPDEHRPGSSVRFIGVDEKAIMSYLVSA